jgi:phosphoethanolamine N-methyltransferase
MLSLSEDKAAAMHAQASPSLVAVGFEQMSTPVQDQSAKGDAEARATMQQYWQEHSAGATMQEMMLDDDAEEMDKTERAEILAMLPAFADGHVLELAAGIGRFTGDLAATARSVTAVDFMPTFSQACRERYHDTTNVSVVCEDVMALKVPTRSHELVFSNWLLMYLSDVECTSLARKVMRWLTPGGSFFFRESCFHQSGNAQRSFNPTQYRHPDAYTALISEGAASSGEDDFELRLVWSGRVEAYVAAKGNTGQMCWLWTKVPKAQAQEQVSEQAPPSQLAVELAHTASPQNGRVLNRIYTFLDGSDVSHAETTCPAWEFRPEISRGI